MERKESFVRLKLWEEHRCQQIETVSTVLCGMLSCLIDRMQNSATENEIMIEYFDNYINIQKTHAVNVETNTQRFIDPLIREHNKYGT